MDCPHRKDEFRIVNCPSCGGTVPVKVFKCDQHGECTVGKTLAGIYRCRGPTVPHAELVRLRIAPTDAQAGMLTEDATHYGQHVRVHLDDGSTIQATNQGIVKRRGIRCVVTLENSEWLLVQ